MGEGQGRLARTGRARWCYGQRQSAVCRGRAVSLSGRHSVAGFAGALWRSDQNSYALLPVGPERSLEEDVRDVSGGCGQRICHDRQHDRACTPAQCRRPKKDGEEQAIGRSKGGLSTKIHAMVDALGNPTAFFLTPGQAHDLKGADALLPHMQADTLLADKAYDADERVIKPLLAAGKKLVIPPKRNRKVQRTFDREMYKARHLMENFFCKLKQYRAIATRYGKTARNFLAAIQLVTAIIWLN